MNRLTFLTAAVGAAASAFIGSSAYAASCPIAGTSYPCDLDCSGIVAPAVCAAPNADFAFCDNPPVGNGDGKCVICGDGGNNIIIGTYGADVICGKGGNDTLRGEPLTAMTGGNDIISGDSGNDLVIGGPGNDALYGGTGNDNIHGGTGDDEIYGESGDDLLHGDQGADAVNGGDGDDYVEGSATYNDGDLGDLLCGNKGDDTLSAVGYGSHCMDAGPDQTTNHGYDCTYAAPPDQGEGDLATARNCAASVPEGVPGTTDPLNPSHRPCNCQ